MPHSGSASCRPPWRNIKPSVQTPAFPTNTQDTVNTQKQKQQECNQGYTPMAEQHLLRYCNTDLKLDFVELKGPPTLGHNADLP